MAKLEILEFPDPRLRRVAERVETVDDEIRTLINDMAETMYSAEGIGLAATQVNVHKRIFIMDFSEDQTGLEVFISPEFTPLCEETSEFAEGCLSVPGFFENLHRPNRVLVKALDRDGKPFEKEYEGLPSVCVQHETDHLDGKLFVDQLTKLKRDRIRKKLEKQHRLEGK